ncbi:MAG: NAD(P)/FAD-dependent oxidoreductase [Pseudomonadota bacterium]
MTTARTIAIVGSGTAGLAAAISLTRAGDNVEIIERFESPKPLGAGLLLQPTGLACLARLGLDEQAISLGAPIHHIYGEAERQRIIFDISYRALSPNAFGLGIHRGTLFTLLYDTVAELGIPVRTHCEITDTHIKGNARFLTDANGDVYGPYDLVIDASGMRSALRRHGQVVMDRPYPYGAIWGVLPDPGQAFGTNYLQQRYAGAHIMLGMLAIGKPPDSDVDQCTFFWSLPPGGYEQWLQAGLPAWKSEVHRHWPELDPFMQHITDTDALTHASYSDIVMKRWHEDRLVFIGDAAHNTSPQLGQGANLALADALVLSELLAEQPHINAALAQFTRDRKSTVHFYQRVSRWLTPFFQSHSKTAGFVRDMSFGLLCKTPWVRTEMLRTLAGIKTGFLSHRNPGRWHSRYEL